MGMFIFCDSDAPEAIFVQASSSGSPIYIREIHQGCVLEERERNMHDDSDFLCLVWHWETMSAEWVEFATTRGWTYPLLRTFVDATPEVRAAYAEYEKHNELTRKMREATIALSIPAAGKLCKVVKGRKIAKGTEVRVLRLGEPKKWGYGPAVINALVTVEQDGIRTQVWTNVDNLEVIGQAPLPSPASAYLLSPFRTGRYR